MSDIDDSKMPLLDHLIELRTRLLWSFAALAVAFGLCFYFAKPIFAVLVQPLLAAGQGKIIYTDIFEAFFVEVKVALFSAMMIAFPVFATQLWRFIAPGLYKNEKRAFLPFLLMTPVLFGLGASMAYFVAMPVALSFLLGFQGDVGGVTQEALPGVGNYLSFVTTFIFGFGVAFLLPVLLLLLERAGIVTRASAYRRAPLCHRRRVRHRCCPDAARCRVPTAARRAALRALRVCHRRHLVHTAPPCKNGPGNIRGRCRIIWCRQVR